MLATTRILWKVLTVTATLGTAAVVPATAAAQNIQQPMAGAACLPEHPSHPYARNAQGIYNWSAESEPKKWVCPLVRPYATYDHTYRVFATVLRHHAKERLCCSLVTLMANGGILSSDTRCATEVGKVQTLGFWVKADPHGYEALECYIPGRSATGDSGIVSYTMTNVATW